jgi:hypothetical protein
MTPSPILVKTSYVVTAREREKVLRGYYIGGFTVGDLVFFGSIQTLCIPDLYSALLSV